jgi:hypothetical protein
MAWTSRAIGHPLAEQPLRTQREHEDQNDESEDVLVVAAEDTAGEVADIAGAERLIRPSRMPPTIARRGRRSRRPRTPSSGRNAVC